MTPEQFDEKYPAHCKHCKGWGLVGGFDGSWDEPPEPPDPCEHCIEQGRCPRCGSMSLELHLCVPGAPGQTMTGTAAECTRCHWREDDPEGRPEPPEDLSYLADDLDPDLYEDHRP